MFKMIFCEMLENRRHLTTTGLSFSFSPDHLTDTQNGVTATLTPGGNSASISISGLPNHKMFRTYQVDPNGNDGVEHGGWEEQSSGFSNGETFSSTGFGEETGDNPGGEEGGGEEDLRASYRWKQHASASLNYSIPFDGESWDSLEGCDHGEAGGCEGYEGEGVGTYVEVWQPTVSIGGGGVISEDSDDSINFGISRDTPWGYVGGSNGDEEIPDTAVSLTAEGTATPGTDYKPALPTSVTLKQYVSPYSTTGFPNSKLVSFKAELDKDYDEPTEMTNYIITANANEYEVANAMATAEVQNVLPYVILSESVVTVKNNGDAAATTKTIVATVTLGNKPLAGINLIWAPNGLNPGGLNPDVSFSGLSNAQGQVTITIKGVVINNPVKVGAWNGVIKRMGGLPEEQAPLTINVTN